MRNSNLAEWLLAKCAGETRASAIMGDLLEQRQGHGSLWFWVTFVRILLAYAWRPSLALICSLIICPSAYNTLSRWTIGMWSYDPLSGSPVVGAAAWLIAAYSVLRYGVRDTLAQVAGILALLTTAAIFFWRKPDTVLAIAVVACALVMFAMIHRQHRTATGVFFATTLVFLLGFFLFVVADSTYTHHVLHIRLLGTDELARHPSIGYVDLLLFLVIEACTAVICSKLHRRFLTPSDEFSLSAK